ncbi:aminotransferase class I/II-fold pyridoxal phosphate-dependent enzyme [Candidatus Bathyarchaeota archaeon]|nr:aminotransferase class I/II-fold pyridoxal phosphate-dependent enzyme [Candidatus Bathyarchaeota archaeon]
MAGGIPVTISILERNEFKPFIDDVTSLITEKSRVMLLNSPNNPTGTVLSFDELKVLAKIAVERDLIVISDVIYEACVATVPVSASGSYGEGYPNFPRCL